MPKAQGHFIILAKHEDNTYNIDLLEGHGIATTFHIGDIASQTEDSESRSNVFKEVEQIPMCSNHIANYLYGCCKSNYISSKWNTKKNFHKHSQPL